jgi:DNA-binding NtrC family response regulator
VILLAERFLERYSREIRGKPLRLSDEAKAALHSYLWPGNVRELQNVLERTVIIAAGDTIDASDLDFGPRALGISSPPSTSRAAPPTSATTQPLRERLQDEEREAITSAIERSAGNIAAASRALGINRSTLYFRVRKYGLQHLLSHRGALEGGDSVTDPVDEPDQGPGAG